ncbi:MAG: PepSY domain-containing protein, partial [Actinocatenispora sp.]
ATATHDRTGGTVRIGSDAAGRAAQRAVPGATVREIELEHEHGRALWEVDLTRQGREFEVDVDATSGKVRHVDRDDDRRDGRDDDRDRHDAGDDHGGDGAGHDVGDDHGRDDAGHDVDDDHGDH